MPWRARCIAGPYGRDYGAGRRRDLRIGEPCELTEQDGLALVLRSRASASSIIESENLVRSGRDVRSHRVFDRPQASALEVTKQVLRDTEDARRFSLPRFVAGRRPHHAEEDLLREVVGDRRVARESIEIATNRPGVPLEEAEGNRVGVGRWHHTGDLTHDTSSSSLTVEL